MAIVEAEIVDAVKSGLSITITAIYRSDGVEVAKESFPFVGLTAERIPLIQDAIQDRGRQIKGTVESDVEVKKLIGTKIVITQGPSVIATPLSKPII